MHEEKWQIEFDTLVTQMKEAKLIRHPHDKATQTPSSAINHFNFLISRRRKINIPCQNVHIKFISGVLTVGQPKQSGI